MIKFKIISVQVLEFEIIKENHESNQKKDATSKRIIRGDRGGTWDITFL